LAASGSKVVAAAITYPLHVMKTCLQVFSDYCLSCVSDGSCRATKHEKESPSSKWLWIFTSTPLPPNTAPF